MAVAPLLCASCGGGPKDGEVEAARITVHGADGEGAEVPEGIYGGFIEFLPGIINGPAGLWAQELRNRGFDEPDGDANGVSGEQAGLAWFPLREQGVNASWSLAPGGYNPRGAYAQSVVKSGGAGRVGLCQAVLLSPPGDYGFYIYMKGDASAGTVTARLADMEGTAILSEVSLGSPEDSWSRKEVTFPALAHEAAARLEVFFTGTGEVLFDEASLMSSRNVGGVRERALELYRELRPGVMRYPGGCFADQTANHWVEGIGPIDERGSPNWDEHWGSYQRLDFGTGEFVAFCRAIGAEPHMVVNFGDGTVEEAAAWVAYANGDPSDASVIGVDRKGTDWRTVGYWARRRAEDGHPEPYAIRHWEIGNEQYGEWENGHVTPEEYGAAFLAYRKAMTEVDPSIRVIADGHHEPSWYGPLLRTIGGQAEVFGWHVCQELKMDAGPGEAYLYMLSTPITVEENIARLRDVLAGDGYSRGMPMSITEWWPEHENEDWDSAALEGGLWTALVLNVLQRHSDVVEAACRTLFETMLIRIDHEDHHREAVLTPSFHVFSMYRRFCGDRGIAVSVECGSYAPPGQAENGAGVEVPYLDVSATRTDRSITLAVVNRHPSRIIEAAITWEGLEVSEAGGAVVLTSASYLDGNSLECPDAVRPISSAWSDTGAYRFPPHSLTVLTADILDGAPEASPSR
ncbi:MAG: hypothetical protein HPY75_13295 [Actinobacteria bacterium]|nr:hypothetical protein [Actinomycetota bacterium]